MPSSINKQPAMVLPRPRPPARWLRTVSLHSSRVRSCSTRRRTAGCVGRVGRVWASERLRGAAGGGSFRVTVRKPHLASRVPRQRIAEARGPRRRRASPAVVHGPDPSLSPCARPTAATVSHRSGLAIARGYERCVAPPRPLRFLLLTHGEAPPTPWRRGGSSKLTGLRHTPFC